MSFRCVPIPCNACAIAAVQIQRTAVETWRAKLAALGDKERDCVRGYLVGIRERQRVIEGLKNG